MKRVYIITGAAGHLAGTIIQYLRKTECEIRGLILPRAVPARAKGAKAAIRLYPAPAAKSSPRIAHRTPSARAASTRSWRGLPVRILSRARQMRSAPQAEIHLSYYTRFWFPTQVND